MPAELTFVEDAIIKFAPDSAGTPGTFATVMKLTDWEFTRGSAGDEDTYFYGEEDPHTSAGDDEDTYSLSGALTKGDTTGQEAMKTARNSRAVGWIQVLPDGTTGEQQKVRVTEYSGSSSRNGGEDFNTISFSLRGIGPVTAVPAS